MQQRTIGDSQAFGYVEGIDDDAIARSKATPDGARDRTSRGRRDHRRKDTLRSASDRVRSWYSEWSRMVDAALASRQPLNRRRQRFGPLPSRNWRAARRW